MVKTWREFEKEVKATKGSIIESGLAGIEAIEGALPNDWENASFGDVRKQPASKFVKTQQRWCDRFIAESYSHANLEKEKINPSFLIVNNAITENYSMPFGVSEVVEWIGAKSLSDGTLQRKILSYLVCLGVLEMHHVKVKNKDGKEKIKYVFVKTPKINPCPNLSSGKCDFDWKRGATTDYFPPEYKEKSEDKRFCEDTE